MLTPRLLKSHFCLRLVYTPACKTPAVTLPGVPFTDITMMLTWSRSSVLTLVGLPRLSYDQRDDGSHR